MGVVVALAEHGDVVLVVLRINVDPCIKSEIILISPV